MRTLKKTLALVLVVAMMMSLCITSNAAFADQDKIKYDEAVEVLTAIGVIDGFPEDDTFRPQGELTRAQAAKILVYILGAENYAKADGQIFDDVAVNHWAADYIAYCAENGLVDGYGNGKFGPEDKLTGYQWAKMLLGAIGVDTSYMIGAAWQIPVAKEAAAYGLFAGNNAADKTEIATREEACLYALNALNYGDLVSGYAVYDADDDIVEVYGTAAEAAAAVIALEKATGKDFYTLAVREYFVLDSLLYTVHRVVRDTTWNDHWGRPGVSYDNLYWASALTYTDTPVAVYTAATTECDIAKDLGLGSKVPVTSVTLNADAATDGNNNGYLEPTATKAVVGAQGRLVEVYANAYGFEIVEIDQFLATVVDVTEAEYDRNTHLEIPAYLTLEIHVEDCESEYVYVTTEKAALSWNYKVGDVLVVYFDDDDATIGDDSYAQILGYADSMIGAQTAITTKASHIIDKVEYMDAVQYNHDEANYDTADYTWYFDTYGNLLGSFEIDTIYNYGVISAIKWVEMDENMEDGYALATITYIDGTSENVKVYSVEMNGVTRVLTSANVAETKQDNAATYVRDALYQIESTKAGLVLTETEELVNAQVTTGVPAIATGMNAGDATLFLVWNGKSYETYTGIENVPSYKEMTAGTAWCYDKTGDNVAEYVFLNGPEATDATASVYYYWDGALTYTEVLKATGGVKEYVVTGGLVNGEAADITIAAANVACLTDILANEGNLLVLGLKNNGVISVAEVGDTVTTVYVGGVPCKAVYAGATSDATKAQNVLMIGGSSYNVRSSEVVAYNGKTLDYNLRNGNGYMYIVYTQTSTGIKNAVTIYITDNAGVTPAATLAAAQAAAKTAYNALIDDCANRDANWTAASVAAAKAAAATAIDAMTYAQVTALDKAIADSFWMAVIDPVYTAANDAKAVADAKASLQAYTNVQWSASDSVLNWVESAESIENAKNGVTITGAVVAEDATTWTVELTIVKGDAQDTLEMVVAKQ